MKAEQIAIIGCGKQAEKHIAGYRANGMSNITVADVRPEVARSFAHRLDVRQLADVDSLISAERITVVDICTPTPSHSPLLLKAIASRKNFLVEKPLCATLDQALAIAQRTRAAGMLGAVGFTYRFAPVFVNIREIVKANRLGHISAAFFRIGGRGSHVLWKHQKQRGGGAIREMLVHMLDLAVWFFGPVHTVQVLRSEQHHAVRNIQGHNHSVDAEDFVLVVLKMSSGQAVTISADFNTPSFIQYAEIQGSEGTAFGSIQPHFPSFVWRTQPGMGFPAGKTCLAFENRNLVAELIADFSAALAGCSAPRCSVTEAVEVQRVLEEILLQVCIAQPVTTP